MIKVTVIIALAWLALIAFFWRREAMASPSHVKGTEGITIRGDVSFQVAVSKALVKVDEAGFGRFIWLNIEGVEVAMQHPDVGGYVAFGPPGSRGTVYVNPVYVYHADWLAGMLVEEACHVSLRNNGQPPCGRNAEYACGWARQVFAECIGAGDKARAWQDIPDNLCLEVNR